MATFCLGLILYAHCTTFAIVKYILTLFSQQRERFGAEAIYILSIDSSYYLLSRLRTRKNNRVYACIRIVGRAKRTCTWIVYPERRTIVDRAAKMIFIRTAYDVYYLISKRKPCWAVRYMTNKIFAYKSKKSSFYSAREIFSSNADRCRIPFFGPNFL